ncbi:DUF2088 domain-containing protein [Paenibacillus radicis (ex Xue et al. 2023)]|uniref:DUF2088 domain-containing protein n=1 Tax=Paenibacillus radicis (ex Xue et al. 2023) TaxID=2972489 RepID=A0ABT1YM13_9BACL|nr:DUF2088 domain-containing protein [Paenibacillus radicis (ex Xue et al. 2023)]MCR8634194.1 DUF2088 domain-containing protein [Paenibacillus radicis (ex Xue et al. 2023)]
MDLFEVRLSFPSERLSEIEDTVQRIVTNSLGIRSLPENATVAITAGSRGITDFPLIVRAIASALRNLSLHPFVVPAMGSHGGATAEGQVDVLRHLGITEQSVGAPILSSMDVKLLGYTPGPSPFPVYMDQHACSADGIIVVNRIKAHTAFRGSVESGLSKMIAIGLGKITGASFIHGAGVQDMAINIEAVSKYALEHAPVALGIAILENGYDETADIVGVEPNEWHSKESRLLTRSKTMMPRLPIDDIDLLVVEQMGKTFSGSGMDPNIIGRWRIAGMPEPAAPKVKRLVVLDLANSSGGNAQGIGLADFTTKALTQKINSTATYTSTITSTFLQRAMLPMTFDNEKEAIEAALRSLGPEREPSKVSLVQIPNTLHLEKMFVSASVLETMKRQKVPFELIGTSSLTFDASGCIVSKITRS